MGFSHELVDRICRNHQKWRFLMPYFGSPPSSFYWIQPLPKTVGRTLHAAGRQTLRSLDHGKQISLHQLPELSPHHLFFRSLANLFLNSLETLNSREMDPFWYLTLELK